MEKMRYTNIELNQVELNKLMEIIKPAYEVVDPEDEDNLAILGSLYTKLEEGKDSL